MNHIEDQINQLFSTITMTSRELQIASYAGEVFCLGTGPLRKKADESAVMAVLNEQENILGLGHPLTTKCLLLSALDGGGCAIQEEVDHFTNELQEYLSNFHSSKIKCRLGVAHGRKTHDAGRSVEFFTRKDLELLSSGTALYSLNFLSCPVTIWSSEEVIHSDQPSVSKADLRHAVSMLRLLKHGDLYGHNGVVFKKEKLLKNFFAEIDSEAIVKGLIVRTSCANKSKLIITGDSNTLYFPFLFDEETLDNIGNLFEK